MYRTADARSTQREKADAALVEVLRLFDSGELPEKVARALIHRQESDAPSADWSIGNQILMLLAGTSDARGFRQWQAVNRRVNKGAKAFTILAPSTRKIEDPETGEEHFVCVGFRGIPVFRLEDTEGAGLPPPADYRPAEFPPLMDVAQQLGVAVRWQGVRGESRMYGYFQPSTNAITLLSHDVSVFFHELAHAAHATIEPLKGGQDRRQEIIAETVAAVLCELYGYERQNVANAAEYVRHYAKTSPGAAAARLVADIGRVLDVILAPAEPSSSSAPVRELVAA